MKQLKLIFVLGAIILMIIGGCSSPMDVDTPREKKIVPGEDYRLPGKMADIYFEENGMVKTFVDNDSYFEIDTTMGLNALWMRLKLDDFSSSPADLNRICIQRLDITLDSVNIERPFVFDGRALSANKCSIQIARGLNADNDTITYAGQDNSLTELTFNLDKVAGMLSVYVHTKVYEHKIWLEYRDSTYIDYIIVTRLDTTYDDQGNMVIKEIKEKVPKEVTVTIEEEKRKLDSLFLNGKFKMCF
jgi:hypothetical protein